MTFFAFLFTMSDKGAPVYLMLAAMLFDTILLATAMLTGVIHR